MAQEDSNQNQTINPENVTETSNQSQGEQDPVQNTVGSTHEEELHPKEEGISYEQLKDQLLRTMAEFENYKKRSEREVKDMAKYAVSGFAKDMVSVSDNLSRALLAVPEDQRENSPLMKSLCEGVRMTEAELLKVFNKNGIVKIDPLNEPFNHNEHQAIMEVDEPSAKPGDVVEVLQSGYKIHDRLLRPAMVKVAKA